jgi:amidase
MDDYQSHDAVGLAALVREKAVSAAELLDAARARASEVNGRINAIVVDVDPPRSGSETAPFAGVPFLLKDLGHDLAGYPTSGGSRSLSTTPAVETAAVVQRWLDAGLVVFGKTNTPEFGAKGVTEPHLFGPARNPWNTDHTPGGSSGGAAAAVAAGIVPCAAASDGGGSIRIPASACGLFGLKPSRGRASLAPLSEGWRGMAVLGSVSRNVLDTALWLDIISGGSQEAEAPPSPERPFVEAVKQSPGKLRVAYSTLAPRAAAPPTVSEEAKQAVADGAELLRSLGHEVEQRDPQWGSIGDSITARFLKGVSETVEEVPHPERLERRTRGFGRLGKVLPEALYERIMARRPAEQARVNAIFDSVDVLVMPVMGGTALPVRRWEGKGALQTVLGMSRFYPYCVPWNHLGNPAMAVPAGFSPEGMPLSIQVIGRPGDEATLLSLAAQLEAERPWADKRPPIS